jgi:hypothetical protein
LAPLLVSRRNFTARISDALDNPKRSEMERVQILQFDRPSSEEQSH